MDLRGEGPWRKPMRCRRALSFGRAGSGLQAREGQSKLAAVSMLSSELGPS